jgi:hypothetical protein
MPREQFLTEAVARKVSFINFFVAAIQFAKNCKSIHGKKLQNRRMYVFAA